MRRTISFGLMLLVCNVALAVDVGTKYDINWVEENLPKARQALEENIQACNAEDIKALMKTLHPSLPGLDEFRAEAEQLFEDTDLYTRILAVEYSPHYTSTDHLRAKFAVYVTQHTVIAKGSEDDTTYFRENSALLPPEYSRYAIELIPDRRGNFKVGMIKTKPVSLTESSVEMHVANDGIPAWFIQEHGKGRARKAEKSAIRVEIKCENGTCRKSVRAENSVFK